MIRSSACQQWHADQSGPCRRARRPMPSATPPQGHDRRIFTERFPQTVQPKARRTVRLGESQLAIAFTVGGEPGSRLSRQTRHAGERRHAAADDPGAGMLRSPERRRLGLAQGTALRHDHLRSGAQPGAGSVAGSGGPHGGVMAGTLSWHRDRRPRSCRLHAEGARRGVEMPGRSPTAGIFCGTWAKP